MSKQRLIDANALVGPDGLFATRGCTGYCEACKLWSEEGCKVILEAPTVDAVEVVHGRWDDECRCTACGWYGEDWYKRDVYYFDYCPNCGAKMDGENNEHTED